MLIYKEEKSSINVFESKQQEIEKIKYNISILFVI
jgi:hypothetical protein